MAQYSIESNIDEIENKLKKLGLFIPNIERKILKKIVSKGKTKLRQGLKSSGIHTKTGSLYKSIYGSAKNEHIAYLGVMSKQAYRFIPLNYGATISAKRKEYLTFKIGDRWVKVKSVVIPARAFFDRATNYVGSAEMDVDVITIVNKEIDKLMQ